MTLGRDCWGGFGLCSVLLERRDLWIGCSWCPADLLQVPKKLLAAEIEVFCHNQQKIQWYVVFMVGLRLWLHSGRWASFHNWAFLAVPLDILHPFNDFQCKNSRIKVTNALPLISRSRHQRHDRSCSHGPVLSGRALSNLALGSVIFLCEHVSTLWAGARRHRGGAHDL